MIFAGIRMKERYRLGLFMGRFQPFHKGHMYALRYAAGRCSTLIVGIGSSQERATNRNPISAKGRIRIIKAAIGRDGIGKRIRFMEVPDFNDNEAWFKYIIRKEPKIQVIFSRNKLVNSIFSSHGIDVISPGWHRRSLYHATRIRDRIRKGAHWQSHVPQGAVREIKSHENDMRRSAGETRVVIGGTFAYLHRGHRALISKAFDVGDYVYIGLITDEYASRMKLRETVPAYLARERALRKFVRRFKKRFSIEPLRDKFGPSTSGDFDAIVVSAETLSAAREINKIRKRNGLPSLLIVKIKYILAEDLKPISTTRIVNKEIDPEGNLV